MTPKTTESDGKNANRAQTERSFKRLSRRSQDTARTTSIAHAQAPTHPDYPPIRVSEHPQKEALERLA
jgi:hypothetical protein